MRKKSSRVVGGILAPTLALTMACSESPGTQSDNQTSRIEASQPNDMSLGVRNYGDILYQKYPDSECILYVVGWTHEHPITGYKPEKYPIFQRNAYRIGEKLIKGDGVNLVLSEGHFGNDDYDDVYRMKEELFRTNMGSDYPAWQGLMDRSDDYITGMLSKDEMTFNTVDLLKLRYPHISVQGYENPQMHSTVMKLVDDIKSQEVLDVWLDYFNEARTCTSIIDGIGKAIDFKSKGKTPNQRTMLLIGREHLDEAIRFARNEYCIVEPMSIAGVDLPRVELELPLKELQYGVVVIKPRDNEVVE
jgi:hypothetical protein